MQDLPPDVKAQLEEQKASCVFCRIIGGEMPSNRVYEDDEVIACLDINPAVKGHILLMPKEHYPLAPLIPQKTFSHLFGLVPALVRAECAALARTGATVMVANGAAAGQQSAHFLVHLLPREQMDPIPLYFMEGNADAEKQAQAMALFRGALPKAMASQFAKTPAAWHKGPGATPPHLAGLRQAASPLYEDEKVLCLPAAKPLVPGHAVLYSKEEARDISALTAESAAHLFTAATFLTSLIYDGLKAQATSIIVKSGVSDDNPERLLSFHVLSRSFEDGLKLMWEPKRGSDLDTVARLISDKTILIGKEKEAKKMQTLQFAKPEVIRSLSPRQKQAAGPAGQEKALSPQEEIERAIRSASE